MKSLHLAALLGAAVLVSVLFYSSFLSNPAGVVDSVRTYATYFNRAGGNELHVHPWYYYLKMLIYSKYAEGPVWSEGFIVLLAVVGIVATLTKKGLPAVDIHLLRFTVFYTLAMTILYSAIPYKTPWCMLGFLHGMILLAGLGGVVLVRCVPNVLPRLVILFLLFDGTVLLLWQAYLGNYTYYADSRNPYVYAHPTTEVFEVVRRVEELAALHEDGRDMPIEVICPGDDYWPLPWYLRSFSSVYWRGRVDADAPAGAVIIASPAVEDELTEKLYELTPVEDRQMYMFLFDDPYYIWLRPQVELLGFVRKDLWDRWYAQPEPNEPTEKAPEK
jgi:predicted membrane-bound mannosyltransferase